MDPHFSADVITARGDFIQRTEHAAMYLDDPNQYAGFPQRLIECHRSLVFQDG
jgi:hypothetical protein